LDYSFKGGLEGAAYNKPSAIFVFVRGKQLVIADQGDMGEIVSAVWTLDNWVPKITGEMGYLLLFGGLVHEELKAQLYKHFEKVAWDAGLEIVKTHEWQG
jgi:hypothetical protein